MKNRFETGNKTENEETNEAEEEKINEDVLDMINYMLEKYGTNIKDIAYLGLSKTFELVKKLDPQGEQKLQETVFNEIMDKSKKLARNIEKRKIESNLRREE